MIVIKHLSILFFFIAGILLNTPVAASENRGDSENKTAPFGKLGDEIIQGFYSRLNIIGFGYTQNPVFNPDLNPDNILELMRYKAELHLRPDFGLNFRRLELSVKPRFEQYWKWWRDGNRKDDNESDNDLYINEWMARLRLTNQLFISYGRENLQWGSAFLLSPSNPFNKNNGKRNPRLEEPGMDYGKVVWIPNFSWTASFIANTDEGRNKQSGLLKEISGLNLANNENFKKTYALKLDYTGEKNISA